MRAVRLTLIGKPGCHLCDEARDVVERVRAEVAAEGVETELEELDILQDPALARVHAESIPVLQINGKRHAIWRVDPARLAPAIQKAARGPLGRLLP
ncbi:glutaredoxin family protein [Leucobacter chromiireducens]|uniref:Glutaredoxin family protein n=1 Tax=Leucobacter chromiireducens subsp. solipictus TaxID=398235 RepID=A0ABS1SIE0_9MICO|nr:glutaredoxin family protein [Leucobacter chromiireducens]MBL3680329.1 glutaredoxin family protein [Leucobacter chromiireducens subsp. solipictus]